MPMEYYNGETYSSILVGMTYIRSMGNGRNHAV